MEIIDADLLNLAIQEGFKIGAALGMQVFAVLCILYVIKE